MLRGEWTSYAMERESQFFDPSVRDTLPTPDLSGNVFSQVQTQLATLFDEPPVIMAEADLADLQLPRLMSCLSEAHLYQRGLREVLIQVDVVTGTDGRAKPLYSIVYPFHVCSVHTPDSDPSQPVALSRLRLRSGPSEDVWTWDHWDCSEPYAPHFSITQPNEDGIQVDVTVEYAGSAEYPYIDSEGVGVFPLVMLHARDGQQVWNPTTEEELVEGTLTAATLRTLMVAGSRDSAYPLRGIFDGVFESGRRVQIQDAVSGVGVEQMVVSPMSVLIGKSTNNQKADTFQFDPAMDPLKFMEFVSAYEAGLSVYAGLSPADVSRGSTAPSGYSLVVSREGQAREKQKMMTPTRVGIQAILSTAARILNARNSTDLPEDPNAYQVVFRGMGKTPEQIKADLELIKVLREAGLMSRTEAYRLIHPESTEEEAQAKIAAIAAEDDSPSQES